MRFGRHDDGALGAVDADLLVGEIVEALRDVRPQVVVTFGPEGAPTAHRDHRAISRAATAAYFLAGNPTAYAEQLGGERAPWTPARLLYVTWKTPADGAMVKARGLPVDVVVDVEAQLPRKREAFLAHATQRQHEAGFTALAMHRGEAYALASGRPYPPRSGGRAARDLFDGLDV
jgi:LmbE family N-acetylglucosaminyl deacetylase